MDILGDRLKFYEELYSYKLMPRLPMVARIDGRCFSSFTKGLKRPFDEVFSSMMIDTALYLTQDTNATIGYTQSDEITLIWLPSEKGELYFAGKVIKIVTALAASATVYFNKLCAERMPEKSSKMPTFDARVFSVPNIQEAANVLLWREIDATKNSISMAAREFYSDKECLHKNGSQKQEMLWQKGVNWNNYPAHFKRGTYVKKTRKRIKYSSDELARLPEKHAARSNPDLCFERSVWEVMDFPPITTFEPKEKIFA